jgi:type II secretory pathway predicted ATPase ExeA/cytoskeletal protein CcmA (bactofilin family)
MVEENESIITRSMVISGSVESHGRVILEGSLEGSFLGRDLDIRLGGKIFGEIKAINIDCAGHMEGNVVTDSFALRRSGRHVGTVETRKLTVEPGAILDCALQSGAAIGPTAAPPAGKAMSGSTLDLEPFLVAFREEVRPCCMDVPWSERLELYSRLLGLLEKDKPLIKVTGESGSGKSVLVEKIRQTLPESYRIVKLLDQTASVGAILQEVAEHLAVEGSVRLSQDELLVELKAALLEKRRCGQRVVLLIDDAEKMFPATMEGIIRTLTDACGDGPRQELLQLILFGTKEMETKMVATTIEYFEDETNCQLYLEPLNIKDTADYLRFSLQLVAAGGGNYSTALLPYETIRKIHSQSHGNIAAINRLADRALRRAHADGASEISTRYL